MLPSPKALLAGAVTLAFAVGASAQDIRIGVLYDLSGPFAAAGSVASSVGANIAIEMVNEKGGVLGKHKIVPIAADAQSKADVAINEAERLIKVVDDAKNQKMTSVQFIPPAINPSRPDLTYIRGQVQKALVDADKPDPTPTPKPSTTPKKKKKPSTSATPTPVPGKNITAGEAQGLDDTCRYS